MTDDDTPDESIGDAEFDDALFDDALFDDALFDDVRAVLGDLTFLGPQQAEATERAAEAMPEDVWQRLRAMIDTEAAARAVAGYDNVVALPPARGASRGMRWAGGLVAASVAVVAVGLTVSTLRNTGDEAAVAVGGSPSTAMSVAPTNELARAADTAAAPEALAAQAVPIATTPAARMVLASRTDYQPDQLQGQVVALVKNAGFTTVEEAMAKQMPAAAMPVEDGFTASWQALRTCLTWLTDSADSQALIVDRGTYAGSDAGVIVAPAVTPDADPDPATPNPTLTVDTRYGAFDVWVVNPECKRIEQSLDDFPLYEWQP